MIRTPLASVYPIIMHMQFRPLGDQAVLAYCANEASAGTLSHQVRKAEFAWVVDVVQAYTSVAIYYDLNRIDYDQAQELLGQMQKTLPAAQPVGRFFTIPCCFEFGMDWPRLEQHTGLAMETIIDLFTQTVYTVYAIGFCPGFPFLGYLPEKLAGVPRLPAPRLKVPAGSVGLTGRQTGIYTEERPGGWNILGRTPLELVNVRDNYFPLRTGDRVQFTKIDKGAFRKSSGNRLESRL
jgi:inhibitor of KinA